jgi:alkylhydroperoxidase family enzyme
MTPRPELLATLDALPTEELRQRAFARARERLDLAFFWSVIKHLPHADDAEELDASLGAVGASVDDAVALWREFTGHGYGESEPLLRAAFIDYLMRHG